MTDTDEIYYIGNVTQPLDKNTMSDNELILKIIDNLNYLDAREEWCDFAEEVYSLLNKHRSELIKQNCTVGTNQ
ncbi:hypothetical protein b3_0179 [Synechococcus phage B3]|nr:hypothetical protein b3_0179 [Synechococcus phage B3]QGT54793.1 hypothetical protein b23_0178 [Synechococcus phage B23]